MQKLPSYLIETDNKKIPVTEYNTVVVGSGAAAFNCAHTLHSLGQIDIAVVTEGIRMGTSRNTGSDKQTYYKVSTGAERSDCAYDMANDMFSCGSMHGDIALVEALGSLRSFFKLVSIGVPFPHSELGEYTGYQTDHDLKCRATSCGPLTSKYMTEALERAVKDAKIAIFDGRRVTEIITDKEKQTCRGVIAIDTDGNIEIFASVNVVYAVGGPSAVYASSVYPESQTCSLGAAFLAGAAGINLTESQYGIASLKFRWNLSGSYQQVIPRYVSCNADGSDPCEFLRAYFKSDTEMLRAVFRKGYEWPFDPSKIAEGTHSSIVDLAVYSERIAGRRVFMDFMHDPEYIAENGLSPDTVGSDSYEYLANCGATVSTPVKRLRAMNDRAYKLYLEHGIDLASVMLEIGVCAQHCNGGLEGDIWYESTTLAHFFPIGEANGVFGVKRPGGSALNSTQVSGTRAAEKIARCYVGAPDKISAGDVGITLRLASLMKPGGMTRHEILEKRRHFGKIMDRSGAFIRSESTAVAAISEISAELDSFFESYSADSPEALIELAINYDSLVTQKMMLFAISEYISHGGKSRGSYMITEKTPTETAFLRDVDIDSAHSSLVCRTQFRNGIIGAEWQPVRPIPHENCWFETVYNNFYIKK